jgi:hypothetical protein
LGFKADQWAVVVLELKEDLLVVEAVPWRAAALEAGLWLQLRADQSEAELVAVAFMRDRTQKTDSIA